MHVIAETEAAFGPVSVLVNNAGIVEVSPTEETPSKAVDPQVIGREVLRQLSIAAARYLKSRDRMQLDGCILDVRYEQVREDPMSVIREIYRRADVELSADAERKMTGWHDSNEQHAADAFKYSLQEFGLSEASIDEAFAEYIRRFIDR